MTSFQVVRVSMAYNAILGRPLLNKIKVIMSTFHLAMKFPTSNGVGVVREDQAAARQCYVASVREINNDVMQISRTEPKIGQQVRLAPVEELMEIELKHDKKVTIGRDLDVTLKTELIGCLSRNIDVFAWKVEDMPGIDPKIAVHKFNISPRTKPKANGTWSVCIDFTDLNKACPKDSYPLPRINNLVDSTSGHKLYSFLDAFSGYHQILMAKEDQEKTSFMADSAIYCYKVMPFDLEEVFDTLRKYKMKLNPAKCAFGVASGKFLGFMITHRGIEANPDKIQALASMESPRNKKEVQRLTSRIVALNRFVSRASNKCYPFFKVLRGNQGFDWSEDCEKAFQELKQTLASPPILTRPEPVTPYFYTWPYIKTWYTLVEQLALALVIAARKLRQYFQSRPIVVLTNQPLRHELQKPDVSGRLMKWVIELGEFDIEFKPRLSIKVQALADFIAELTPRPRGLGDGSSMSTNLDTCQIFVDGASNSSGSGVGVIIISPNKHTGIQCALRFEFEATNNEAEYEVVVIALELALSLELEFVKVFSDSQLVVGQIEGSFKRKDKKMSLYCMKVQDLQRKFKSCEIAKIARKDNGKVDALSRLVFMGVDSLDRTVYIKVITEPSINQIPDVMDIDNEPSWMDPIIEFITSENLPSDARSARSI
ncbi:uncharacterized protein LOC111395342 [Olea europaea var. sylvestris]|uniref:uncharacterized protein LOC111395342 n=1 Tax=Olea europaea var. sylvestris TaxID=158386 RepID=UPI000C1D6AF9|nr:uncharacterized protein LOC111395342 [Olea europaea var. sylvestris]